MQQVETKNKQELPFGIDFVVQQDLANSLEFKVWKASNSSYDITCPFCGSKRKMNINTSKNVAKCNKCGCGKGYNTITLHASLTGLTNSEAYKDLLDRWNGLDSSVQTQYLNYSNTFESDTKPAPIEIRDKVYRAFLSHLELSDKHRNDLLQRGLTEQQIKDNLYKSVPVIGLHTIAYHSIVETSVIDDLYEHKQWGIPGFTDIRDVQKMSCKTRKSGYFVPVLTKEGLISGMQIRYDKLPNDATQQEIENYKKYSWYSSSESENGCSVTGCENIHFAGNWKTGDFTSINLTEGVLKADVASALSNTPFIGLVGVNNIAQLSKTLSSLQYMRNTSNVNIYVDMDYRTKKEVANALVGIKKEINRAGVHTYNNVISEPNNISFFEYNLNYRTDQQHYRKGFELKFENPLPKKVILTLDSIVIPEDKYLLHENDIQIEFDYINCIGNKKHTFRVIDITKGFEQFNYLTPKQKQELLNASVISIISFEKTGLTYKEMNWNEKYKGIDDYLLYLKSIGCTISR